MPQVDLTNRDLKLLLDAVNRQLSEIRSDLGKHNVRVEVLTERLQTLSQKLDEHITQRASQFTEVDARIKKLEKESEDRAAVNRALVRWLKVVGVGVPFIGAVLTIIQILTYFHL